MVRLVHSLPLVSIRPLESGFCNKKNVAFLARGDYFFAMRTQCPYCKEVFKIPSAYVGKQVKCRSCKESFTAANFDVITRPEQADPPPPSPGPHHEIGGYYLQAIGVLGIIVALLFHYGQSSELSMRRIGLLMPSDGSFTDASVFLIDTLISGICLVVILLSLGLFGLGSMIKAAQRKR